MSVKAGPPAAALLGEREVNVGPAGPMPTWTIFATDGYSASVQDEEQVGSGRRNMWRCGRATTLRPPVACEKPNVLMCWLMLKA